MNWWQRLRNRDRLERELDAELRYHFDREVADNVRMGMSILVGIAVLLAAVSFAAAFFPARRATGLDPLATLRSSRLWRSWKHDS